MSSDYRALMTFKLCESAYSLPGNKRLSSASSFFYTILKWHFISLSTVFFPRKIT